MGYNFAVMSLALKAAASLFGMDEETAERLPEIANQIPAFVQQATEAVRNTETRIQNIETAIARMERKIDALGKALIASLETKNNGSVTDVGPATGSDSNSEPVRTATV